ncbi:ArsR/SmtB family transcription factor [Leptospira sp. GIMC2001]|uniref:ArsR/SmtB family transcription factor n=1 Tax=Leptospira sp. GIMC2001 TaxID=1513297 RepID=UPI00234995C0|nr:ArsR family transcriptional regulator [Leptospira sp. GIMC2001]WCL48606.1 ArsR family transcriptional regulator [Leptospira sp. GIMC2001]
MTKKSAIKLSKEELKEKTLASLSQVLDAKFLTALSEPSRVDLLKQVIRMERADISQLSEKSSLDRSVISRHLNILFEAGILGRIKEGRQMFYFLNPTEAIRKLRLILENMEEIIRSCC